MNSFDLLVCLGLVFAVIAGFRTGLLRSAVTILAYLIAMPLAIWVMSLISPGTDSNMASPLAQNSVLPFGIFLLAGMILGKLARTALDDVIGPDAGIGDRLGGATLGAVRVGLIATTLVLVFDQLIPAGQQPAYLTGSLLRPWLSMAGQMGLRSLPPDVMAYIDHLKRDRSI